MKNTFIFSLRCDLKTTHLFHYLVSIGPVNKLKQLYFLGNPSRTIIVVFLLVFGVGFLESHNFTTNVPCTYHCSSSRLCVPIPVPICVYPFQFPSAHSSSSSHMHVLVSVPICMSQFQFLFACPSSSPCLHVPVSVPICMSQFQFPSACPGSSSCLHVPVPVPVCTVPVCMYRFQSDCIFPVCV